MQLQEAVDLISPAFITTREKQQWLDLGCGSGLFTRALASLLPIGSRVTGVDRQHQDFSQALDHNALMEFYQADFTTEPLPFAQLHGILMANSLHFVKQKKDLIRDLQTRIRPNGHFIIVEYDTRRSNAWVPYPIAFEDLQKTSGELGYTRIEKIGERESVYSANRMYAAHILL